MKYLDYEDSTLMNGTVLILAGVEAFCLAHSLPFHHGTRQQKGIIAVDVMSNIHRLNIQGTCGPVSEKEYKSALSLKDWQSFQRMSKIIVPKGQSSKNSSTLFIV